MNVYSPDSYLLKSHRTVSINWSSFLTKRTVGKAQEPSSSKALNRLCSVNRHCTIYSFIYAHLDPQRAELCGFVRLRTRKSVCKAKRRNTFIRKNSILLYKYLLSICYVRHSVRDRKYQGE